MTVSHLVTLFGVIVSSLLTILVMIGRTVVEQLGELRRGLGAQGERLAAMAVEILYLKEDRE